MTRLRDVLEYAVVHEFPHFVDLTHSEWFVEQVGNHYPSWNEATAELIELPLARAVLAE
ncbi:MAG: DUF45 domain-containing protein [Bryobacterales bacterium]|nr:DUF45 domain-containing protein [Bryobacterales bacterium]MDE0263690.1 DUF45 domain-containing protein [Bryobacterales bacterium]MDE0620226.1 DUF45 domain-containing protein [Bryobacterales bacterium]